MMQSTGQTSRQDSQPVQLSALMTASSLGSFLRGPCLAIGHTSQAKTAAAPGTIRPAANDNYSRYHNHRKKSAAGQPLLRPFYRQVGRPWQAGSRLLAQCQT